MFSNQNRPPGSATPVGLWLKGTKHSQSIGVVFFALVLILRPLTAYFFTIVVFATELQMSANIWTDNLNVITLTKQKTDHDSLMKYNND